MTRPPRGGGEAALAEAVGDSGTLRLESDPGSTRFELEKCREVDVAQTLTNHCSHQLMNQRRHG